MSRDLYFCRSGHLPRCTRGQWALEEEMGGSPAILGCNRTASSVPPGCVLPSPRTILTLTTWTLLSIVTACCHGINICQVFWGSEIEQGIKLI